MSSDSDTAEDPGIVKFFQSVKDSNRLTYLPADKKFVMSAKDSIAGSEQRIVGNRVSSSGSSTDHYLSVYKVDSRLDFYPHEKDSALYPSEPNSGPSQVWSLIAKQKKVWLIKSSNGGYLKNNGVGKPITIYQPKKERDLNDKTLQWRLIPYMS